MPTASIPHGVLIRTAVGQTLKLDHLWAALGLVGAVYFAFRK
jgi:uncharacterized protein (DUF486 family)